MSMRCLIVDDAPSFLEAARHLLEREGLEVAGVASTSAGTLRMYRELRPDLVLVDIDLGGESGFDLAGELSRQYPGCRVILISAYSGTDFADLIEDSAALAFIPKPELSAAAIRAVLRSGAEATATPGTSAPPARDGDPQPSPASACGT